MNWAETSNSPVGPFEWLAKAMLEHPNKLALVVLGERELSFGQLYQEVEALSGWLSKKGVGAGDRILVCLKSPIQQRLCRLAASRLGAVDALVDPSYTSREIAKLSEVIEPKILICESDIQTPFPCNSYPTKAALEFTQPLPAKSVQCRRILFTSGSTGTAKAVMLSGAALSKVAAENSRIRSLTSNDRILSLLPVYHAAGSLFEDSIMQLGATIILANKSEKNWFKQQLLLTESTVTTMLPSHLERILESFDDIEFLNTLRLINLAGEKPKAKLLKVLSEHYQGVVTRGYGMSETGPLIAVLFEGEAGTVAGSVGRPANHVETKIAPIEGIHNAGQLMIRSPYLMEQYFNNRQATEAAFIDGWFATQDIARLEDGQIVLLGRMNNCIKSGGKWIQPSEVEEVLSKLEWIANVSVTAIKDSRWSQRPCAVIELSSNRTFDVDSLKQQLEQNLSRFKWPEKFLVVDSLPTTLLGKLDLKAIHRLANGDLPSPSKILHTITRVQWE